MEDIEKLLKELAAQVTLPTPSEERIKKVMQRINELKEKGEEKNKGED